MEWTSKRKRTWFFNENNCICKNIISLLFFFILFPFFSGEFWNVRQNGVARISSYERGGRAHDWQVEENQTNYFEHAAFSKMGLRLFSRLVIITGTSLLLHPRRIYQPTTRADAQEATLGQDFVRYLLAVVAHVALQKLVLSANHGNHRRIMNCLDTRD